MTRSPSRLSGSTMAGSDDGSRVGNDSCDTASVTSPPRQAGDHRSGLRLSRCRPVDGRWAELVLGLGRKLQLRPWLGQGLGPGCRMNLWNRVDPGGGLVLSARAANWLVSLLSRSGDHGGDRPVFKVGWRLDTRRKVLDDPADLAVLVDHV